MHIPLFIMYFRWSLTHFLKIKKKKNAEIVIKIESWNIDQQYT